MEIDLSKSTKNKKAKNDPELAKRLEPLRPSGIQIAFYDEYSDLSPEELEKVLKELKPIEKEMRRANETTKTI
jgi:CBS-domain-containing membrane protein